MHFFYDPCGFVIFIALVIDYARNKQQHGVKLATQLALTYVKTFILKLSLLEGYSAENGICCHV